jgi:hypothetical protein
MPLSFKEALHYNIESVTLYKIQNQRGEVLFSTEDIKDLHGIYLSLTDTFYNSTTAYKIKAFHIFQSFLPLKDICLTEVSVENEVVYWFLDAQYTESICSDTDDVAVSFYFKQIENVFYIQHTEEQFINLEGKPKVCYYTEVLKALKKLDNEKISNIRVVFLS